VRGANSAAYLFCIGAQMFAAAVRCQPCVFYAPCVDVIDVFATNRANRRRRRYQIRTTVKKKGIVERAQSRAPLTPPEGQIVCLSEETPASFLQPDA